jgi:protein arginine N-methyltransferase 1
MITDKQRMNAYAQVLQQEVSPGCVVLDIGAGTGIFSLLACQFGAGHVHAVEPNNAIEVARSIAVANNYEERITFHQKLSTEVKLPQQADVIISDMRGVLPLFQHHIPSIIDARMRLLVPGGKMIPKEDSLWAALVDAPELYKPYMDPWLDNNFGLDMHAGQSFVVNTWCKANLKPEQLLVPPQHWATLDYETIEDPNITGELTWDIENSGIAHGLVVWFETTLGEGIGFSNSPGQPELIYGQAFFPLAKPVKLTSGDKISVRLKADLVGEEYIWKWDTRVLDGSDNHTVKAEFKQSTFYGEPLSPSKLRRQASSFVPHLNDTGEVDLFILKLMNGSRTLEEIAKKVKSHYPDQYKDWRAALKRVGELSQKYSS